MPPLLLYLLCAFGLMPFNRMNSKSHVLMDYIVMLIFPAFYVTCFIFTYIKGDFAVFMFPECASTCTFINKIFLKLGFFLYLSVHVFSLFRRKNFYTVFEKKLKIIDDLIVHCQHVSQYKPKKEKRSQYCGIYLLLGTIGISVTYVLSYDVLQMVGLYKSLFWIPLMTSSFPYVAASIVQLQFIAYVSILLKRFTSVNELLQKIDDDCNVLNKNDIEPLKIYNIDSQSLQKSNNIIYKVSTTTRNIIQFHKHEEINKAENFNEIPSTNSTSELILPQLFELHDKLLTLCEITNDEYGPQTVPYMACCFIMSVLTIFVQTKVMIAVGAKNHFLNYTAIEIGVWTFCICTIVYIILNYCYTTNGCSKTSAMIVHEIMQKKPAFMQDNDFFYNKMKSFSLQYLHWENYFNFNGIGLFVLDYTLIFAVVSAGTSYLIVLLQFDMTLILKGDGLL